MFTTPVNKTTRRSIKRSPSLSPEDDAEDSYDDSPDTTPSRPVRPEGRADVLAGTGDHGTQNGMTGHDEGSFGLQSRSKHKEPINPILSSSGQPRSGPPASSETDEQDELAVVDTLINRMERNMRIVSSTSAANRPRMSELEALEVDGVLGEVGEEEVRNDGIHEVSRRDEGTAREGSKPLKSLRQPAIQPRMNKSTLARLNPTTSSVLHTPSRRENQTPRRPVSVATSRPNEILDKGSLGDQMGTPERQDGEGKERKRKSMVLTPASLKPPAITPRSTRSSDLRATIIKDPSYFSPTIDTPSTSRLAGLTKAEIKEREAKIFQGTPGHKRELGLKDELWSLRRATPHRTNRSADLRRDPTLAIRPATPTREFKARPLPAMYGAGIHRESLKTGEQGGDVERPKVRQ